MSDAGNFVFSSFVFFVKNIFTPDFTSGQEMVIPFFQRRFHVKILKIWRDRAKIRKNREVSRTPNFSIFSRFLDFGRFWSPKWAKIRKFSIFFFWSQMGFYMVGGSFWGHFEVFWGSFLSFFGFSPLLVPFLKGFWISQQE